MVVAQETRDMAMFDAGVVAGLFQLHLAGVKALEAEAAGQMATKSLHGELLYNCAAIKHVGESFRRCGVAEGTTSLLLALFDASPQQLADAAKLVKGRQVALAELPNLHAPERIQQAYKVTKQELEIGSLEDAVIARMAARDC